MLNEHNFHYHEWKSRIVKTKKTNAMIKYMYFFLTITNETKKTVFVMTMAMKSRTANQKRTQS